MPDEPSPSAPVLARALAACRFLLLVAVIGCLIVAVSVLLFGAVLVIKTTAETFQGKEISIEVGKSLALAAIETIDLFLIGTVAYITAAGLYTLFISHKAPTPLRLGITSLNDLKEKIIGVVVVALGVLFLGDAVDWSGEADLLYFGGAIAVVIVALGYFMRHMDKHDGDAK